MLLELMIIRFAWLLGIFPYRWDEGVKDASRQKASLLSPRK